MNKKVLIRGGGDLASGVAARLHRSGFQVLITELPQPLVVRRLVSFAEAVYTGRFQVEEITAKLVSPEHAYQEILGNREIPVLIDPDANILPEFSPDTLVDARMTKRPPNLDISITKLVIGLGPGFIVGENCHAVIETLRSHDLGRVIWQGSALPDTGIPEAALKKQGQRVLRAPANGELLAHAKICDQLKPGDQIAEVNGELITAPFKGVLRGLLKEGLPVIKGMKIGDLDPRNDVRYCTTISDKALAVGGGILEAVMSQINKNGEIK